MDAQNSAATTKSRSGQRPWMMPPFRLLRPETWEALAGIPGISGGEVAFLGGGCDLLAEIRLGRAVSLVVWTGNLPGAGSIESTDEGIVIGCGVSHMALARFFAASRGFECIGRLWHNMIPRRVALAGTIVGNICAGNPAYDGLPLLRSLNASLRVRRLDAGNPVRSESVPLPAAGAGPEGLVCAIVLPAGGVAAFAAERRLRPDISVYVARPRHNDREIRMAFGGMRALAIPPFHAIDQCSERDIEDHIGAHAGSDSDLRQLLATVGKRLLSEVS